MTISDNAALKVVQEINLPGDVVAVNVYYFLSDFTAPQAKEDVVDECAAWIEVLYNTLIGKIYEDVSLGEMTLYEWNDILVQWDNRGTGAPTRTFTVTTDMLPHGVAALVRAYTTEPRTIGRKYIPGVCEIDQMDGTWVAGMLTALAGFGDAWNNDITINGSNWLRVGVWSTVTKAVFRLSGVEVVLASPAYQRRRRPGVGT